MNITTEKIVNPYEIKKMGTSGLRQTQDVYNQPQFLEQFAQGVALYFKELTDKETIAENNKSLLIGGDPRLGNRERIDTFIRILLSHGFTVYKAKDGLASTPAMSHGIRHLKTAGGIILTASHNPYTDVGIKLNSASGAPALEDTVERVHELQNSVTEYTLADKSDLLGDGVVEVDLITLYGDLLDSIFDFEEMKNLIAVNKTKGAFDSMHGAAGPFAKEVFEKRLAMDCTMVRYEPREDLGGVDEHGSPLHPEPDFDYISQLIELNSTGEYDVVAAWDSDVDRRLDGGRGFFLESADEFAVFARFSDMINLSSLFPHGGFFCRSTVTADTIDKMREELQERFPGSETVETPTGFKWIADLGNWGVEESNGVGNPYLREKDGIFATVFLLKIILKTGKSPRELMEDIWKDHGRVYFARGEVSGSESEEKDKLAAILETGQKHAGETFGSLTLNSAESWNYIHPRSGEVVSKNAAWVLNFSGGNSVKARFSGTGSGGYTLRVYCSKFDPAFDKEKSEILQPMKDAFDDFLFKNGFSGKSKKYTDAHQPDIYGRG